MREGILFLLTLFVYLCLIILLLSDISHNLENTGEEYILCYNDHSFKLVDEGLSNCDILIKINKDAVNTTAGKEVLSLLYKSYGD